MGQRMKPMESNCPAPARVARGGTRWKAQRTEVARHCLAAAILLAFALSHFAAFNVRMASQGSLNTVLPWFTNRVMFLLAGTLELATATACLRLRGRAIANLAVLVFIVTMLWYRWALHFTGGEGHCDCMGALGMALHLSPRAEKLIAANALCLLALLILPWVTGGLARLVRVRGRRGSATAAGVVFLALARQCSCAQQTFTVTGRYDTQLLNPQTGAEYTNEARHVAFAYTLSGRAWSIYATNVATTGAGSKMPWEGLVYDGTNTYTLAPNSGYHDRFGRTPPVRVTISPGQLFLRDYDEWLDFDVPWVAYGLRPRAVLKSTNGVAHIPLPWWNSRCSPLSHGFDWDITASPDGNFMSRCRVVRDTNLDLSLEGEMFRTDMNNQMTAGTLSLRNWFREGLDARRDDPNGKLHATYRCNAWFSTDGMVFPKEAEEVRTQNELFPLPTFRARLEASHVTVRPGLERCTPNVRQDTLVADYRYRLAKGTNVLPYLMYVLPRGSPWKAADDPALLLDAQDCFRAWIFFTKHNYRAEKHKALVALSLLALAVVPLTIAIVRGMRKRAQRQVELRS